MRHLALAVAAVVALAAAPARAGLYFEQTVETTGQGPSSKMRVRGWADGDRVRIDYLDSDHRLIGGGTYLLTADGGETTYLVNPKEKSYSRWDLAAVFSSLTRMNEATGGMMEIDFRDPHSESLGSTDGGTLLGYATRRHGWRSAYTMAMKIAFLDRSDRVESVTHAWVTDAIRDPALKIWFRAAPPATGDPELDELLAGQAKALDGLPLKLEQETTTTDKKGKQSRSRTLMEINVLRRETPDAGLFAMPVGYTEKPLVAAPAEEEKRGRKGGFGGLKSILGKPQGDDGRR